jgi:dephospho-CoA kinase
MTPMITIGLLGGVASGKSLVASMLGKLGAGVLDADRTGHDILANDSAVARQLADHWGPRVLSSTGEINRAVLGEIVFSNDPVATANRRTLEAILHPAIRTQLEQQACALAKSSCPVVVLDAPLLVEAGWDSLCDLLLFVDTPVERRRRFAIQRGWEGEEMTRRETAQLDLTAKRRLATACLANQGDAESLAHEVEQFWENVVLPKLVD